MKKTGLHVLFQKTKNDYKLASISNPHIFRAKWLASLIFSAFIATSVLYIILYQGIDDQNQSNFFNRFEPFYIVEEVSSIDWNHLSSTKRRGKSL